MPRVLAELEPTEQADVNRLVVGDQSLCIESLEPLGDICLETPSGWCLLHHAASAHVRCRTGQAVYLFGEADADGRLLGARAS